MFYLKISGCLILVGHVRGRLTIELVLNTFLNRFVTDRCNAAPPPLGSHFRYVGVL